MKLIHVTLFALSIFSAHLFAATTYQTATVNTAMHTTGTSPTPLTTIQGPSVRLLVFTTYTGYQTSNTALGATIWATVEPDIKTACTAYVAQHKNITPHQLNVWIAELLGLPTDNADQRNFVVMNVPVIQAYYGSPPSTIGIYRPCTDPRIGPHADGSAICPQWMNAADTNISSDFKTWFINNSISSYTLNNGAPWTEYGYTYNYDPQAKNHYGMAEFIVLKNTPISVLANPLDATTAYLNATQYCSG